MSFLQITFSHSGIETLILIPQLAGVTFYSLIPIDGAEPSPDWLLGILFGTGGLLGMYLGARALDKDVARQRNCGRRRQIYPAIF